MREETRFTAALCAVIAVFMTLVIIAVIYDARMERERPTPAPTTQEVEQAHRDQERAQRVIKGYIVYKILTRGGKP